jgi:hypothetical protein
MFGSRHDGSELSREIAEIDELLHQLQRRVGNLTHAGMRSAASGANQFAGTVSGTLSDLAEKFRSRYGNGAQPLGDAAKLGQDAWRRVAREVEHRPLLTLAVAIGIGYLAGMATRRD